MQPSGARGARHSGTTTVRALLAAVAALGLLAGCGSGRSAGEGSPPTDGEAAASPSGEGDGDARAARIPGLGDRTRARIPDRARQVVAVHGAGAGSADARVELWTRPAADRPWTRDRSWSGHNGKRGWTPDHHEGGKRSPVGVFTLSDAGGVLPDPGTELPYTHSAAFTPPAHWPEKTRHDFDYVIAVDYNRVPGTSPLDPTRPEGQEKGGFIWLHVDHGSGTSGCVSVPEAAMKHLLRTLDPDRHPVVVMGDRAALRR
ncbi:L,D-transpeptidase family protein [Streptomyces sp. JJ36]|uniref:L,D-transpeptidase family protein n=1 Tax=Streptomyces sp. JJ36 TaxID=2736645 RepID=UPI001F37DC9C|nr:L,D-transpeptidase family protein [Streptomyces sp. JJ36]MCF6526211.1 hypothetical protein [Streptomyces sp. JJ36]